MADAKSPTTSPTPPPSPSIGKIGPYTVFVTPSPAPTSVSIPDTPKTPPPPVQLPPIQYPTSPVDRFAFLRHALLKLQTVHASVDEYMSNWLGLDQSKYQWALNDYYEANGMKNGKWEEHYELKEYVNMNLRITLPVCHKALVNGGAEEEKGDVLIKEVLNKSQTV